MLSRQGHHVSGFTEPQAALAAFRADPNAFDVIVTDLSMPAMSGFDLATAAHALRPDIPVVMTTGWLRAEDELKARQAGIAELVMKPVSMSDLHELIVEVTRRPMYRESRSIDQLLESSRRPDLAMGRCLGGAVEVDGARPGRLGGRRTPSVPCSFRWSALS
jgi:DNA-binding NtrC family response regulator